MLTSDTIRQISESLTYTATSDTIILLQPKSTWADIVRSSAIIRKDILDKLLIQADSITGKISIGFGVFMQSDTVNPLLNGNTNKMQFIKNTHLKPIEVNAISLTDLDNYKTIFSKGSDNIYRTYIDVIQMSHKELFGMYISFVSGASVSNLSLSIISAE